MRALQKAGDTRGMAARPAPAAPDGIERNIDRLRAEIREAEAGVARLRNRLEVLASDARIARPASDLAASAPATGEDKLFAE